MLEDDKLEEPLLEEGLLLDDELRLEEELLERLDDGLRLDDELLELLDEGLLEEELLLDEELLEEELLLDEELLDEELLDEDELIEDELSIPNNDSALGQVTSRPATCSRVHSAETVHPRIISAKNGLYVLKSSPL